MKNILKKHGLKIGIAVFAAVLIVVLSSLLLSGRTSFLENALDTVMQPLEKGAAGAARWLEGIYDYMYKFDSIKAENEELKLRVSELEKQAGDYVAAIGENARLRELLGFKEDNPGMEFISASAVSWTASNWSCAFTISKGSNSGIEMGDCVIDEFGNLLGQVTELGSASATVRVLLDPAFEAGALIERSGVAAIIEGDFQLMQNGALKLSYLPDGAEILNGDAIITSGKGGVLPRGLIVGSVQTVKNDVSGLSAYAVIKPAAELSSVSQVFVVTDFEVTE